MRNLFCQLLVSATLTAQAQAPAQSDVLQRAATPLDTERPEVSVGVNESAVLDQAGVVRRVLIGSPEIADALAVSPTEIVVNGKLAGNTTLMIWAANGARSIFDVHVIAGHSKLDAVREQLSEELPGQSVSVEFAEGSVFLRGTVNSIVGADRAVLIASTLGKVVDLMNVKIAPSEPQILLRVRFANVDRAASIELGANFFSTGIGHTIGAISTGQFSPPSPDKLAKDYNSQFSFADALNVLLFNPNINLGATIKALQAKQLAEILAEPNLLTISGKPASFLAGGEFPYPTLQGGGAGVGQITIQFREFGVRLYFLPTLTPRGTIHLVVIPEVSSLDFANGLTVQGFTVPGLAVRRVQTEIELASGQSFAIAGLLDNRLTETISKVPGLGDIPILGKLFQSKAETRNHSELLVLVTPEFVDPIAAGAARPDIPMPKPFTRGLPTTLPNPAISPAPAANWIRETLPAETLRQAATARADTQSSPGAQPSKAPGFSSKPPSADPANSGQASTGPPKS